MLKRLWATPELLLCLATLFWSGNFVLGRALHEHIPPVALSFWRWTVAFLIVLGFALPHLRKDFDALWRQRGLVVVLAALGVASFNALVYYGLNTTTVTNAVLMQSIMPVLIIVASYLIFREPVRGTQMLALLISLVGVTVIIAAGSLHRLLSLSITTGDAVILVAVVGYALYSALLRKRPQVHALSFLAATFLLGALMLLPFFLYEHFQVRSMHADRTTFIAIAYVGVFPSLLAYMCFNRAVELMGANRAGQFLHLMPVFGSALAALFIGERLQAYHLLGAALIAAGIVLARRVNR